MLCPALGLKVATGTPGAGLAKVIDVGLAVEQHGDSSSAFDPISVTSSCPGSKMIQNKR